MSDKESCEQGWVTMCRFCDLAGKSYSHGSEVLKGALAMQCVDGKWRERVNPFVTAGP
ncbi:MAG: hypothetical protein WAN11_19650 [Syntrophobacteraceae bacterium]